MDKNLRIDGILNSVHVSFAVAFMKTRLRLHSFVSINSCEVFMRIYLFQKKRQRKNAIYLVFYLMKWFKKSILLFCDVLSESKLLSIVYKLHYIEFKLKKITTRQWFNNKK
jgi:hypothetical protein